LIVLILFMSCSCIYSQQSELIQLMDPVSLDELGIEISPPSYWNPQEGQQLSFVAYSGPSESGVFPQIKIFYNTDEGDLIQSKAILAAKVRVSLLNNHLTDITLVDEVSTRLGGRDVLEQLFTCKQGSREVTAMADYFNACGRQYIFVYYNKIQYRLLSLRFQKKSKTDHDQIFHFYFYFIFNCRKHQY